MHVLYFHQHFSTPKGSSGIRSYFMARQLVKRGHEVTMVCGSYEGGNTGLEGPFIKGRREGLVDGIHVVELELNYSNKMGFLKRSMVFLSFAMKSIKIALFQKSDIIFATSTPLTAGLPGIFAKIFKRKKFIFEVRDLWPELPREMKVITNPVVLWAMGVLEWCSYHAADRAIGLSPGIAKGIASRGINEDKIRMIPNGCDIEIFGSSDSEAWRPDGVGADDFMAVFTGTHGIANGLDAVLNAALELKKRNVQNIKFVLIGSGKLKASLKSFAEKNALDNVIFCDPVSKDKLSGLLNAADAGLQILANIPSFYYGTSPNKFFDYLAAGLPVVCNYPGWVSELISENKCGIVVEPENAVDFANKITELANLPKEKRAQMGVASNELAHTKFHRAKLADEFVAWLEGK